MQQLGTLLEGVIASTHAAVDAELAKQRLWSCLIATTIQQEPCELCVQGFLSVVAVGTFQCSDGTCIYSTDAGRVNLNVIIANKATQLAALLERSIDFIFQAYPGHSIDVMPLANHVPIALVTADARKARRFLPNRFRASALFYDPSTHTVRHGNYSVNAEAVLTEPSQAAAYTPVSRMTKVDAEDTRYWHRMPCGALVVFRNPTLPPPTFPKPDPTISFATEGIRYMMEALHPTSSVLKECVLHSLWIPPRVRQFAVYRVCNEFGMSDELILQVGSAWADKCYRLPLVADACRAHAIKQRVEAAPQHSKAHGRALYALAPFLASSADQETWLHWARRSSFVCACLMIASPDILRRMCCLCRTLAKMAACLLKGRTGAWQGADKVKVQLLVQDFDQGDVLGVEFARMVQGAKNSASALAMAEPAASVPPKAKGKPSGRQKKKRAQTRCREEPAETQGREEPAETQGREEPAETQGREEQGETQDREEQGETQGREEQGETLCREGPAPDTTHGALVTRLAATLGMSCELIGSGLFWPGSDADIVVTVPDTPALADAYAVMATALRRVASSVTEDVVTGDRVAVVRGVWEGVALDVQVWRGEATTRAEEETERALRLSRALSSHTDAAAKAAVRSLHQWAHRAGVKGGHKWARLPGVALTCLAVLLRCDREETADLLSALRDALACDAPAADLTQLHMTRGIRERPTVALAVQWEGRNLASHMTVATTRHLLDCVSVAPRVMDYAAWRRRHMIVAARLPASASALVACAVRQLDGHPLLDTVHVEEEEPGGGLVVRVTMHPLVASTYGFRDDDEVELKGDEAVIRRGGRCWPLHAVSRDAVKTVEWAERVRVTDWLHIGTAAVANAPSLTVDVMTAFRVH